MSMDASAIKQIQNTAPHTEANQQLKNTESNPAIILPDTCKLVDIEHLQQFRNRFRAALKTNALEDFANYYGDNQEDLFTQVFVQPESMTAKAIFNLYEVDAEPGHGDHTASLTLVKTAPFRSLRNIDGDRHSQQALAEWMEDWRDNLRALDNKGELLNINQAIAAIRRITIEATAKSDSEVTNFGASQSAMESIEAKSEEQLPAYLQFTCEPYKALSERTFTLRLAVLTGHKTPQLTTRVIKLEEHEEAMAEEFKNLLKDSLPENAKIYIGGFNLNP
ncbi:hypothetical protein Mag101_07305 [Microbulbifer agarilyticus]|uniref:DUF2303 domain-containing protein n=1 Tax=Microbulbifer agarilyticus TaxID=260552 RepID=A0A1Q2M408_9GAMM|nr:DUF2303 family protein [Microbulbifer agarilyticus]AQQ67465.1 hypothetical protein Mag101_07305 [Microbulbifer agarilyticus]